MCTDCGTDCPRSCYCGPEFKKIAYPFWTWKDKGNRSSGAAKGLHELSNGNSNESQKYRNDWPELINLATCLANKSADTRPTYKPGPGVTSIHSYRCTCVAGFANGVCEYTSNPTNASKYDFIAEYKTECTVMESMDNPNSKNLTGNCNIDVDECKSNPCKNGATCTDSTTESAVSYHAYQCTCVAGFANGVCEYTKNKNRHALTTKDFIAEYKTECTVMESMANGTSVTNGTQFGNCDIDVNECKSNPCKNGAICTDSTNNTGTGNHEYWKTGNLTFPNWKRDTGNPSPTAISTKWKFVHKGASISYHAYQCTCVAGFANGLCGYAFINEFTGLCKVRDSMTANNSGNCADDVDECASKPCKSGKNLRLDSGTCSDSNTDSKLPADAYSCKCFAGE
jgi:Notch-like protein